MRVTHFSRLAVAAIATFLAPVPAFAIIISATQDINTLTTALLGSNTGIIVTGATLSGHQQSRLETGQPETSSGTYTNSSGTYGIGSGMVLSTGAVEARTYYDPDLMQDVTLPGYSDGPNTNPENTTIFYTLSPFYFGIPATPAQETLLDPITTVGADTFDHFDVTELVINFDMAPGFDSISIAVVFGSEEWPEYVPIGYFDGFGVFLNGSNIAFASGQPVNISHPDMAAIAGTELNAVLAPGGNPLLVFDGPVSSSGNTLRFIIGDREDAILDSTVYVSNLQAVPEASLPASMCCVLTVLGGLFARRRHSGTRAA